jgi:hypothetical protein
MAMNRKLGVCFLWLVILTGSLFSACYREASKAGAVSGQKGNEQLSLIQSSQIPERNKLIALGRDFGSSDPQRRELAWQTLNSYSRSDLIEKLVRVQKDNATDEPGMLAIAFVLCSLDFDYETNKKQILAAFEKEPHHENPYSDWEAGLLARLMQRADDTLLPALFSAAPWSDGALATDLGGIYLNKWRSDPQGFLSGLKTVPITARRQVYFLLLNDELLTSDDSSKMKTYLRFASHDRSVGLIAQEMLAAIPEIEKQHKQNTK